MNLHESMAKRVGEAFLANPNLESRRIRAAKDAALILQTSDPDLAAEIREKLEELYKEHLQ